MKSLSLFLFLCLLAVASFAQTTPVEKTASVPFTNIYAGGISFNNSASPEVAGSGLYARLVNPSSGTYAFTVVDALPTTVKPFTVTSNFSGGVAQKVFSVAGIPIFVPTSAGVSFNGPNTGWAWSTGAIAPIKLKNNWYAYPNVRTLRSNVAHGSGYQLIVGLFFGWAK